MSIQDPWFKNITYLLTYSEFPEGLKTKKRRDIKLKATKYVILDDKLFKISIDVTFLRCIDKQQRERFLKTFHDEACHRNFPSLVTALRYCGNATIGPECLEMLTTRCQNAKNVRCSLADPS